MLRQRKVLWIDCANKHKKIFAIYTIYRSNLGLRVAEQCGRYPYSDPQYYPQTTLPRSSKQTQQPTSQDFKTAMYFFLSRRFTSIENLLTIFKAKTGTQDLIFFFWCCRNGRPLQQWSCRGWLMRPISTGHTLSWFPAYKTLACSDPVVHCRSWHELFSFCSLRTSFQILAKQKFHWMKFL